MQGTARNIHYLAGSTDRGQQVLQRDRASPVGAGGETDEDASRCDQHIAAIYMTLGQLADLGEPCRECPGQFLSLCIPAWRTRPQEHGRLAEYQRRILHEDRIRKLFQRLENRHLDASGPQSGDVRLVLGNDAFEYRRRTWVGAQAIDDASPG